MADGDPSSGSGPPGPGPPDISSLKENFHQQQAKISALKELVRQSEANQGKNNASAQEKVKNIAQRLSHLKSKASKSRQSGIDKAISEKPEDIIQHNDAVVTEQYEIPRARSETAGSEKIQLLRKQMEQNRQKMVERENSKRGIEELVTQLKAKVDSSKTSLEKTSQLGRSVGDLSIWSAKDRHMSSGDISGYATSTFEKERLKFLERRVRELEIEIRNKENEFLNRDPESEHLLKAKRLESRVLDLEEALKEKECVIDARTQAVSLLSENLSLKGKNTVDLLEETKQEMLEMQKKFIEAENGYRVEIERLKSEIDEKNFKIANMDQVNDILETARFDLTVKNSELEEKFDGVQEFSNKLSELNKINQNLQHRIADLESDKNVDVNVDELESTIDRLQSENDDLKKMVQSTDNSMDESLYDKIKSLENVIKSQSDDIDKHLATIERLENNLQEKTIEYNVLNVNFSVLQEKLKSAGPKSLFSMSTDEEAEAEITKLKSQLDEANKSMIKTKLKAKQLQKQLDSVKKSSNPSADVIRLTEENQQLQQQISEMKKSMDGHSLPHSDLEKKLKILETTCQNQVSAIQLLEEQKIDMTADLQTTKIELTSLKDHIKGADDEDHIAMVTSHMDSIELEEKIDEHSRQNSLLKAEIDRLTEEKLDLSSKLTTYMTENMELLEKLDKISKGSSAESIELIENLTHQEKLEMEEFQKGLQQSSVGDVAEADNNVMSPDLSESLVKLREESSELMHKIEMFTNERREVLDKMEDLKVENLNLIHEIDTVKAEKDLIQNQFNEIQKELSDVEKNLKTTQDERALLLDNVKDLNENRSKLQDELNNLIKNRNAAVGDITQSSFSSESSSELAAVSNDDYEKGLRGLEAELENYKKGKDKSVKSKKLAKEAKNVYELLKKLLIEYGNSAKQVAELRAEIDKRILQQQEEKIKLLLSDEVDQSIENKAKMEIKASNEEIDHLKSAMKDLQLDCERLQVQLHEKDEQLKQLILTNENTFESELLTLRIENDRLKERVAEIERTLHFDHETIEQKTQELIQLKLEFDNRVDTANKEIDILKTLVTEQKEQLIDALTEHETEITEKTSKIDELESKLVEMSKEVEDAKNQFAASRDEYVEQLQGKVAALKTIFDENNDLLEEQANELRNKQATIESLNAQIMDLYKLMEENANRVVEKEDEVNYLQELIERNEQQVKALKDKCDKYDENVRKLEAEVQKKSKEIDILNHTANAASNSEGLEKKLKEYENIIKDLETKNKDQLDKLKKFAANLKKKNAQCSELEQKLEKVQNTNKPDENHELTQKLQDLQQLLFQKDQEINVMRHESNRIAVSFQTSSNQDTEKDSLIEQLKSSHAAEISKLWADIDRLNHQIEEINEIMAETTHAYNSDASKKSAELENLKLRLNEKVQLTDDLSLDVEKKSSELQTLRNSLQELNKSMTEISNDLKAKNVKIEKCRAVIKDKNHTIQKLTSTVAEYQKKLEENQSEIVTGEDPLQAKYDNLRTEFAQSIKNYDEVIATLQNELEGQKALMVSNVSSMEIKNQENELYIESLRDTNLKLNEKIAKLEEGIGNIEERRSSLERHAILLGSTLQEKTSEFQKNEDELLTRLQALSQHDETIEKRLTQADMEKQELEDSLTEAVKEKNGLLKRLQSIETQMHELQNTKLLDLESDNSGLLEQVKILQQELKRQQSEFERKMEEQRSIIVDLENDLSAQLQRLGDERRELQHNLEKCKEENDELKCDIVRFKEIITSLEQTNSDLEREMTWIKMQNDNMNQDHMENQELRMQVVHDQTEIENLKEQTETLQQNHEREVAALKQQIIELDSLRAQIGQNQTDDQVFIQNENERLQTLLATKDLEIQNYRTQNLQLQMSFAPAPSDPFLDISTTSHSSAQTVHVDSDELLILSKKIDDLELKLQSAASEISTLQHQNSELQIQSSQKDNLLHDMHKERNDEMEKLREDAKDRLSLLDEQNKQLIDLDAKREMELKRLREENGQYCEAASKAISQAKIDELLSNIKQLEEYIADLQIQLRISTNDCEQTAQMIQSLENEIQTRTVKYEAEITSLKHEVDKLMAQQPVQEMFVQKTVKSVAEAEPPQFLSDIEKLIIPADRLTDPSTSDKQSSGLPSFNSSMFFGSTEPTAFDNPFSQPQPDLTYPYDQRPAVVEPVIIPKKAYLCQPDESQSEITAQDDDNSKEFANQVPVVEEICVPKKAYLCHPDQVEDLPVPDDGWGFGSDDAILEEKHQQMSGPVISSLVPAHIGQTLQDYEDTIQQLQTERDRLREEKIALQVQSAKMLKKLKEYKTKNEQLSTAQYFKKSPSIESNDLDLAIQEELNNQVKMLETRLKEIKTEQDKENLEKQNLLKRIDVLTSANDTMVDLKQRQDNELETCKSKICQLSQKIEQLEEWSDDNYNKTNDEVKVISQATGYDENVTRQIEMLSKQVNDARMDGEEIQALLDEEKSHSSILEDRIKKLQESLLDKQELEDKYGEMIAKIDKLSAENMFLKTDNMSKTETISQLESKINQLKAQINESIATIDVLSQESNNIKTYLDQLKEEHRHKIDENNNLCKELSLLSDKNVELSGEVERMKSSGMFGEGTHLNVQEVKELEDKIQELTATIQYKDAEIGHLNQKVADVIAEDQTQSLVQEILNKNFEITNLRTEVNQLTSAKDELENNLSIQLTKEIQGQKPMDTTVKIMELEKIIVDLRNEKDQMEHELQVLNDQVLSSLQMEDKIKSTVLELDMKNIEISELKNSLDQLKQNQSTNNGNTTLMSQQIDETISTLNAQWEQVMEQRCSEVAEQWRQHLAQRESQFSLTEASLRQDIDLLHQALRQSASETIDHGADLPTENVVQSDQSQSDLELISKMQEALENQEMEIVTLKEQLAIRSAEYARIVSQVDPFGQMSHTSSMMTMDVKAKKSSESLESSAGQKSELDLALYMLHQRDMRCEELTEELIHLLEERDTLQLKLSNSIRQIEDIRLKTGYVDASSENDSADASPEKPPSNRSSVTTLSETPENQQNAANLNAKISQLQNVSHSRDKTLREEREQRQRQMAFLQRDVASLPPEAVAELIGADYTLSRQSQSPSSVLLNWLWGKSTPRPPDST